MKLVLFDIDGTLLWSDGAGRSAMTGALEHVFGSAGPASYRYDGKTDLQIARELMRMEGHDEAHIDARLPALVDGYLQRLERELAEGRRAVRVLDGVPELLDALGARDDVVLGLLTGNVRTGAELKLRAAGIEPERFRVAAYGSDHHAREHLPAIAQRRAREELGLRVAGEDVVVIGDTPADITCGREIGARAVAVATGRYSTEELRAYEPAAVFPSFANTEAVLATILASVPAPASSGVPHG